MIRMIGSNSGDFVCTQVIHNLWKLFLCKKHIQESSRLKKENKKKKLTINEANNKSSDNNNNMQSNNNDSEARSSNNNKYGETSDNENDDNYEDEEDTRNSTNNTSSVPTKSIMRNVRVNIKPKKKTILLRLFKSSSGGSNRSPPSRSPLHKNPPLARSSSAVAASPNLIRAQSAIRKNLVIQRMSDNYEGNRFQSIKRVTVTKRVTTTDNK
jgi:hypothetical protein